MKVTFHIEYFAGDDEQMYIVFGNAGSYAMASGHSRLISRREQSTTTSFAA